MSVALLPLAGMTVVVTGEVPGLDRKAAQAAVTLLGGKPSGSVSARTDLVVVGAGAGAAKMSKVRHHGVPVLTAEAFAALAADPGSWDGTPVGVPVDQVAPAPVAEPVPLGEHLLTQVVVYPDGVREVRMRCTCGHAWLAQTLHAVTQGCPTVAV